MADVNELNDQLEGVTVIKRNGKKVDFDGAKIALAIKKGFDSVEIDDEESEKYIQDFETSILPLLEKELGMKAEFQD